MLIILIKLFTIFLYLHHVLSTLNEKQNQVWINNLKLIQSSFNKPFSIQIKQISEDVYLFKVFEESQNQVKFENLTTVRKCLESSRIEKGTLFFDDNGWSNALDFRCKVKNGTHYYHFLKNEKLPLVWFYEITSKIAFKIKLKLKTNLLSCKDSYYLISKNENFHINFIKVCDEESIERLILIKNKVIIAYFSKLNASSAELSFGLLKSDFKSVLKTVNKECVCGQEKAATKIVGGSVTKFGDYPWTAALFNESGNVICGASLISSQFLISSAHCFTDNWGITQQKLEVAIGAFNIKNIKKKILVEKVIIHPNYSIDNQQIHNDIAVLKLATPLELAKPYETEEGKILKLITLCLPPANFIPEGDLKTLGWGFTEERGLPSDVLKEVTIPLVSQEECQELHGDAITADEICAGGLDGQDSCKGDSGGPLLQKWKGYYIVVGITSYGLGCGEPDYFGVYARVTSYIDWIEEIAKDSEFCDSKISDIPSPTPSPPPPEPFPFPPPIYPNLRNCGIPFKNNTSSRVSGGEPSEFLEFPWTAVIVFQKGFMGSGVLIAPNFVITTAYHLKLLTKIWDFNLDLLKVVLGEYDLSILEGKEVLRNIKSLYFHPFSGYVNAFDYDAAILELSNDENDTEESIFRPICLPKSTMIIRNNTTVVATGWGITSDEDTELQNILQKTRLNFMTSRSCKKYYPTQIKKSMFCASGYQTGLCFGDGGTALMFPYKGRFYLVGIYSWGAKGCSLKSKPSVFLDVRMILDWISYVTGLMTI